MFTIYIYTYNMCIYIYIWTVHVIYIYICTLSLYIYIYVCRYHIKNVYSIMCLRIDLHEYFQEWIFTIIPESSVQWNTKIGANQKPIMIYDGVWESNGKTRGIAIHLEYLLKNIMGILN